MLWEVYDEKRFPLLKVYIKTSVFIDTGKQLTAPIKTKIENTQGCCISLSLFNIYLAMSLTDRRCSIQLSLPYELNNIIFVHNVFIIQLAQNVLQRVGILLDESSRGLRFDNISIQNKFNGFCENYPIRTEIDISDKILEQVSSLNHL